MKGYLVKLYPNQIQQKQLDKAFGCNRWVYNHLITIQQKKYHRTGKGLSGYDMQSYLPKIKKQYPWLKEANSQSLQIVCHNLADAYNKFFRKQGGYPTFKKKNSKQSFSCITSTELLDNKIKLPKIGLITFRGGDKPQGRQKTITISKDATGYYASILFENKQDIKQEEVKSLVGIDVGIKDFAVCSNGIKIENQKHLKKQKKKLKTLQQKLARQQKGSKKRQQNKIAIARLHKKITNQRKDYNHKNSRLIVNSLKNHESISVENLNIKGMMKNHKLAENIADCGWSSFINFLKYKTQDVGKQTIEVDRFFPSTRVCSECGVVNNNLTLKDREWTCNECGSHHNRDFNSAVNLSLEGLRIYKHSKGLGGGISKTL